MKKQITKNIKVTEKEAYLIFCAFHPNKEMKNVIKQIKKVFNYPVYNYKVDK